MHADTLHGHRGRHQENKLETQEQQAEQGER